MPIIKVHLLPLQVRFVKRTFLVLEEKRQRGTRFELRKGSVGTVAHSQTPAQSGKTWTT